MNDIYNPIAASYRWGTECGTDLHPLPGGLYPRPSAVLTDWSSDFHLFAVEWTADALTFSVDGNEVYVVGSDNRLALPTSPM
jgi:beta-glucanase (GH16 family)